MEKLAVFIEDSADFTTRETVGRGEAVYIHYRRRRGLFPKARLARYRKRAAEGAYTLDRAVAEEAGLPLLSGDAARLVHASAHKLLPPEVSHLALFPGVGWQVEAILEMARRVRFLELIGEENEGLAARIEEETGLSVPLLGQVTENAGKCIMRLPGAPSGSGLDLTAPNKACVFLPPPPLRRLFAHTDGDGNALEALVRFFGFAPDSVGIFCRNLQKICQKREIFSYKNNKYT